MNAKVIKAGILFVLLFIFSFPSSAKAQSIYCVSATTGSDATGDGTPGHPWATIQHAIDTVTGTAAKPIEIRVAGGNYYENIIMNEYKAFTAAMTRLIGREISRST